jgi:hypothetical protein
MHSKRRCPPADRAPRHIAHPAHRAPRHIAHRAENVTGSGYNVRMPQKPPHAGTPIPRPKAATPATPEPAQLATPQPAEPAAPQPAPLATPQPAEPAAPLPAAVAVRRLVVPDSAPPYDDELQVTSRPGTVPQGAGPAQPSELTDGSAAPGDGQAATAGWPGQFAQVLAETLAGSRPPRQITPWTTEQARRHIKELGPLLAVGQRPQVRRVVTSSPVADVVEMTAVVTFGPKIRARAVRLERDDARGPRPGRDARTARWLCTAVEAA